MKLNRIRILLIAYSAVLLLTSCQATPGDNVVINKADDALIQKIEESSAPKEKYKAPGQWAEDIIYQNGQLSVILDASVSVPSVDAYPVVRIVPDKFGIDQAKNLAQILLAGKTLYEPLKTRSKEEIKNEILQLKKQVSVPSDEVLEMKKNTPEAYTQYINGLNQQIQKLEDELSTAPESTERKIANIEFKQDNNEIKNTEEIDEQDIPQSLKRKVFSIETDIEKKIPTTLNIWTYDNDNRNFAEYLNFKDGENPVTDLSLKEAVSDAQGSQFTEKQACNIACKAITGLGLKDMSIAAKASGVIENENLYKRGLTIKDMPQCYVFYFTRNIGGIQTTYTDVNAPNGDYSEPWPYERIKICVYESGINELYWVSPAIIKDTVSSNVALLPFDQIQDIFKKQIEYKAVFTGYKDEKASIKRTININKITLGMARIEEKDKPGQYLMIPVWDFFGSYTDQYPKDYKDTMGLDLNQDNQISFSAFAHSFLTINAIDGSVIDRGSGY